MEGTIIYATHSILSYQMAQFLTCTIQNANLLSYYSSHLLILIFRMFGLSQILESHPGQVSQKFWYSLIFQSVQYAINNKTRVHNNTLPMQNTIIIKFRMATKKKFLARTCFSL